MNEHEMTSQPQFAQRGETIGRYTARAFIWMAVGLLITFAVSLVCHLTNLSYIMAIYFPVTIVLSVAEVILVVLLVAKLRSLPITAARALFLAYAVLNGVVFSAYFIYFDLPSLALAFGAAGLYFGVMAVVGYTAKVDFSRIRNLLFGGLIFLLIFGALSMLIPAFTMMDRLMCLVGIVVFMLCTAYDTQKIKAFYNDFQGDDAMLAKATVISALELYLDFINLFLYLLRFFGKDND